MAGHWPGYGSELPGYTYLSRRWFDRFEDAEVHVRRSEIAGYVRRSSRVIVTLRRPA